MRSGAALAAAACVTVTLSACGGAVSTSVSTADLGGTIWCAPEQHSRLAVDRLGVKEVKEGKDICLSFTAEAGSYIVKVVWWNVSKEIHLEEWAVALPVSDTELKYVEADHPGHSEFVGIVGAGDMTLTPDGQMTLVQLGHLSDGSAAGFLTTLTKVDRLPDIPVPLTYPTF